MKANASAMRRSLDGDFDCCARPTNEADWAAVLFEVRENSDEFNAIKLNSPFAGMMVIAADLHARSEYFGDVHQFRHAKGGIEMDIVSSAIKSILREKGFADAWNRCLLVFGTGGDAEIFHFGENKKP